MLSRQREKERERHKPTLGPLTYLVFMVSSVTLAYSISCLPYLFRHGGEHGSSARKQEKSKRGSDTPLPLPVACFVEPQIKAKDGTPLYGALYRPDPDVFGPPPYRTVVSVYGGPHVQTVSNSWMGTIDMRAQYLRSRGMLVWKLDNRGSSRRGLAFEGAVKNKMGRVDVEDQETGVQWLLREGLTSQSHIGIYGWSYGGYMAAMTLAQLPHLFRCAVAGAPVTSWDGYDTHYTERYMGLPKSYPAEYEHSSVMHHVAGLQGKLLLVHGMIDENVHFRHTARLINALTAAAKDYDLLLFPDERHMPRGLRDRIYMEERIFDFLHRNV